MKHLFAILFIGFSLISCSNEEKTENDSEPLLKKLNVDVAYPGFFVRNQSEINFGFEYDKKNRLTKVTGGYLPTAAATGFNAYFTNKIFTSLTYSNNKVTVENFSDSDEFTIQKGTITYTINSSGQIEEKEVNSINKFQSKKYVFKYTAGKLTEIVTSLPNIPYNPNDVNDYILTYSEKFYYDANSNLIKTEFFEQYNGENTGKKIIRTFEDYDNSVNPFKKLHLLEGYFYRSLSKNNFTKYTEIGYYYETITSTKNSDWTFTYDSNGNIVFN